MILDPCCGSRMFWFDKDSQHALFGDIRDDGSLGGVAHSVGSYATMTELVKAKSLVLLGDEVDSAAA